MRRKLRLDPEALRVHTFRTDAEPAQEGTVRGHDLSGPFTCIGDTCPGTCFCPSHHATECAGVLMARTAHGGPCFPTMDRTCTC